MDEHGLSALAVTDLDHLPGAVPQAGTARAFGPIITAIFPVFLNKYGVNYNQAYALDLTFHADFGFSPDRRHDQPPKRQRRGLILKIGCRKRESAVAQVRARSSTGDQAHRG